MSLDQIGTQLGLFGDLLFHEVVEVAHLNVGQRPGRVHRLRRRLAVAIGPMPANLGTDLNDVTVAQDLDAPCLPEQPHDVGSRQDSAVHGGQHKR